MRPLLPALLLVALIGAPMATARAQATVAPDVSAAPQASAPSACGGDLPAKGRRQVASVRHQLVFVLRPAPAVGRHFGLDLVVCPLGDASMPLALRIDADMPAHRHGMNYRPTVRLLGDGRYRVEGLLFHMAGKWRLLFELSADGRLDRLSHELNLE